MSKQNKRTKQRGGPVLRWLKSYGVVIGIMFMVLLALYAWLLSISKWT